MESMGQISLSFSARAWNRNRMGIPGQCWAFLFIFLQRNFRGFRLHDFFGPKSSRPQTSEDFGLGDLGLMGI